MSEHLKKLLQSARDVQGELSRLDETQAEDKKTLATAGATADINDPKVQRRVGEARFRLDMIAGRRGRLERDCERLEEALRAGIQEEKGRLNALVAEAKNAAVEARIKANLPFWEGDEKACRRYYDGGRMFEAPCFYSYDRLFCSGPLPGDPIRAAQVLLNHIARVAKILGWTDADLVRTPAPQARAKVNIPATLRVRATEAFTSPCLLSQGKNKKRPGFVAEGQELVVSVRQFRAMAKFLEPVEPLPEGLASVRDWDLPQDK